jgi:hypothetical protein
MTGGGGERALFELGGFFDERVEQPDGKPKHRVNARFAKRRGVTY